jgi:cell division protein FtsL
MCCSFTSKVEIINVNFNLVHHNTLDHSKQITNEEYLRFKNIRSFEKTFYATLTCFMFFYVVFLYFGAKTYDVKNLPLHSHNVTLT